MPQIDLLDKFFDDADSSVSDISENYTDDPAHLSALVDCNGVDTTASSPTSIPAKHIIVSFIIIFINLGFYNLSLLRRIMILGLIYSLLAKLFTQISKLHIWSHLYENYLPSGIKVNLRKYRWFISIYHLYILPTYTFRAKQISLMFHEYLLDYLCSIIFKVRKCRIHDLNHVKLKNIPRSDKLRSTDNFVKDTSISPQDIYLPVLIQNGLPGLRFYLGDKSYFLLIDSGAYHNLISKQIIDEFERNYFTLDEFNHDVILRAHNHTPVKLLKTGKIVPLLFADTNYKTHTVYLPFLIELESNASLILGFKSIRDLGINPSLRTTHLRLSLQTRPSGSYLSRYCSPSETNHLDDGLALLEKIDLCHSPDCPPHPIHIRCCLAQRIQKSPKCKERIINMLSYDPLTTHHINPNHFQSQLCQIINHNVYVNGKKLSQENLPFLLHVSYVNHTEKSPDLNEFSSEPDPSNEFFIYFKNENNQCIICQSMCECENIQDPSINEPVFFNNTVTILVPSGNEIETFVKLFPTIGPYLQKIKPEIVYIGHKRGILDSDFGQKMPTLMKMLFSQFPPPSDCHHLRIHMNENTLNLIHELNPLTKRYDTTLTTDSIGLPESLSEPETLQLDLPEDTYTQDLAAAMKFSNPKLRTFLEILFTVFDSVYSKSSTDLGNMINPNYTLDLKLKDKNVRLPAHKPYDCTLFANKATMLILKEWEKSGIIARSNISTHCMRLLVVKKKLALHDFETTKDHLKKQHNITISDQSEIFQIDPTLLPIKVVQKAYRVVADSRAINQLTVESFPLQQSTQNTLFDLILNLNGGEDKYHPKQLRIKSPEFLKNLPTSSHADAPPSPHRINWTPPEPDPANISKIYRHLNANKKQLTEDDSRLHFSAIDLKGAHQMVPLSNYASYLLNVISPLKICYQFRRSCFGLAQINSHFNGCLIDLLHDLICMGFIYLYSDDALLVSYGSLYEHSLLITEVISRFWANGIKISINKSLFGSKSFEYLGFRFDNSGIYLTEQRKLALINISPPQSKKAVQSYLGSLQYISYFYPGLSLDTHPISDLLCNDTFFWSPECQAAYEKVKQTLAQDLKLHFYDPKKPLYCFADSSARAGACVCFQKQDPDPSDPPTSSQLSPTSIETSPKSSPESSSPSPPEIQTTSPQLTSEGLIDHDQFSIIREMKNKKTSKPLYKPLLFLSRKYNKADSLLHSALEAEILNIVDSLYKLAYFIDAAGEIILFTDAKSVLFLLKSCQLSNNARLSRLATKLSLFPIKFQIVYCPPSIIGLKMADFMSRQYDDHYHLKSTPTKTYRKITHDDISHNLEGTYSFAELFKTLEDNPDMIKLPADLQESTPMKFDQTGINLNRNESFIHHFTNQPKPSRRPSSRIMTLSHKWHLVNELTQPLTDTELTNFSPLDANVFLSRESIMEAQSQDPQLQPIIQKLSLEEDLSDLNLEERLATKDFTLINGVLCKPKHDRREALKNPLAPFLIVIPDSLVYTLVGTFHVLMGHAGPEKIYSILKERYLVNKLHTQVFDIIPRCLGCQVDKPKKIRKDMIFPSQKSLAPNDFWALDFFTMYKSHGFSKILIIIDLYSSYTWAFKCKNEKEKTVINCLDTLFSCVGHPVAMKSDNGTSLLRSKTVAAFLRSHGVINLYTSLAFRVSHNAVAERQVSSIRSLLKSLERGQKESWPRLLTRALNIHNATVRDYDGEKITPYEKYFLHKEHPHALTPDTLVPNSYKITAQEDEKLRELVNTHHQKLRAEFQKQYNDKAGKPNRINIGDLVLLLRQGAPGPGRRSLKTLGRFLNKLFIVKNVNGLRIEIENLATNELRIVDSDALRVYKPRGYYFDDLPDVIKDQMGGQFSIDLRLDDRKRIITKLLQNQFETGFTSNDPDLNEEAEAADQLSLPPTNPAPQRPMTPLGNYIDNDDLETLDLSRNPLPPTLPSSIKPPNTPSPPKPSIPSPIAPSSPSVPQASSVNLPSIALHDANLSFDSDSDSSSSSSSSDSLSSRPQISDRPQTTPLATATTSTSEKPILPNSSKKTKAKAIIPSLKMKLRPRKITKI